MLVLRQMTSLVGGSPVLRPHATTPLSFSRPVYLDEPFCEHICGHIREGLICFRSCKEAHFTGSPFSLLGTWFKET